MKRGDFFISPYAVAPLFALIAILQSTVTSHIRFFGVTPDLILLFTVTWVLLQGAREGAVVPLVGAVMTDVLSGASFGLATTSLVIVGYLVGVGEINVFRTARLFPYAAIGSGTLIYNAVFLILLQMTGHVVLWGPTLWRVVLPSVVVNTIFMPPVYHFMRWLCSYMRPEAVEWE